MSNAIEKLLNPSAIAILGATEGEHRIGGRVEGEYVDMIYPFMTGRSVKILE